MIDQPDFWSALFKGAMMGGGVAIAALIVFSVLAVILGELGRWARNIDKEKEGKDE